MTAPIPSKTRPRKIVSIGGGTGLSSLLRGLKRGDAELSVIVTVTDDGGSSGRLRKELNVLPPGDIRNCMIALSEDENLMARLFRFRFDSDGSLHDHSFGNLFLTAMATITGDFLEAVRLTSEVLAIKGTIFPSTTSNVQLRAELEDGTWITGETRITADHRTVRRIELGPRDAQAPPDALEAITSADVITIGPGSLYTSLIPNLLVRGIIPAIRRSRALKLFIQNIMTQPGETDHYSASRHVQALVDHASDLLFPVTLLNTGVPSTESLRTYGRQQAHLVEIDQDNLKSMGLTLVERNLLAEGEVIRHDPSRLARSVFEIPGIP